MALEIERRFLITEPSAELLATAIKVEQIAQGYLSDEWRKVIRIRTVSRDGYPDVGFLTVKGSIKGKIAKIEIETPIDVDVARELLTHFHVGAVLSKTRYTMLIDGNYWELDKFHAPCEGLWIAELEVASEEEAEALIVPCMMGREVTKDYRYSNSNLSKYPWPFPNHDVEPPEIIEEQPPSGTLCDPTVSKMAFAAVFQDVLTREEILELNPTASEEMLATAGRNRKGSMFDKESKDGTA
mgnify:CR=1 FL=1